MNATTPRRLAAALLASTILFTGCSAVSRDSSAPGGNVPAQTQAPANEDRANAPAAPGEPKGSDQPYNTPLARQLARKATVTITTTDHAAAAGELRRIAGENGGFVSGENVVTTTATSRSSTVTLSVPADKLDATLEAIGAVGTVTNRTVSTEDVTEQVADVDSRVRSLRASIDRLNELMKRAGTVTEIASVERELTNRQSELESLLAQQKSLQDSVARSPITVTLQTPATASTDHPFLRGLEGSGRAMMASINAILLVGGALLPFAAIGAAIAFPIAYLRRRAKRSAPQPTAPQQPEPRPAPRPAAQPSQPAQPPAAPPSPSQRPAPGDEG